jgi:hypothetical protein
VNTLRRAAKATRRAPANAAAKAAPQTVAIRWSVSRQALRTANGARPSAMIIAEQGPDLELRWEIGVTSQHGAAVLSDPATGAQQQIVLASVQCAAEGDLLHIEASDGAVVLLSATVRAGEGESSVLYARTSLLEGLGLRGGRYEVM